MATVQLIDLSATTNVVETLRDTLTEEGIARIEGVGDSSETFRAFCDQFTTRYTNDAMRRNKVDDAIFNVDVGDRGIPVHSESSFTTVQPQVISFACLDPGAHPDQEATTVCDGHQLWEALSSATRQYFVAEPIHYDLRIDVPKRPKGRTLRWPILENGCTEGEYDQVAGTLSFRCARYAATKGMGGKLAFCNHLLEWEGEVQILDVTIGGAPIPDDVMAEVREAADRLTIDHVWSQGDVVVLDNLRWMHGRRSLTAGSGRNIAIAQSLAVSFT